MDGNESFFVHNISGGVGGGVNEGMVPKLIKTLLQHVGQSRVLCKTFLEGFFSVLSSFDPLK